MSSEIFVLFRFRRYLSDAAVVSLAILMDVGASVAELALKGCGVGAVVRGHLLPPLQMPFVGVQAWRVRVTRDDASL